MIPRDGTLAALGRFLVKYSTNGTISGMTIDIIMKMTRLVLRDGPSKYRLLPKHDESRIFNLTP
jgi:hypothetical protein